MAIYAVSFDVWDTLLRLKPFLIKIAQEIATQNKMNPQRIYKDMVKNYQLLKEYRRKGMLRNDDIVNNCLELSSQNLGISIELLKEGVTKAVVNIETKDLLVNEAPQILDNLYLHVTQIVTLGNLIFWPGSYNRILLERSGLTRYFKYQLYADEIKYSKPNKEIFSRLCKTLHFEPYQIVHIGDNKIEDFEGALNFGLYGIWVNHSFNKDSVVKDKSAVVNSIKQIPSVIELFERN